MIVLCKSNTGNNLLLERVKCNRTILYSQNNGVLLPILKCSNAKLAIIFSHIFGKPELDAVRLDWDNTYRVIDSVLDETPSIKDYKPSSVMHYNVSIQVDAEKKNLSLQFVVWYHLWKRVLTDDNKYTFTNIITEEQYFSFNLTAEDWIRTVNYIGLLDEESARQIWENAINVNFIMDSDYDFGEG